MKIKEVSPKGEVLTTPQPVTKRISVTMKVKVYFFFIIKNSIIEVT